MKKISLTIWCVAILVFLCTNMAVADDPDCQGPDRWPAKVSFGELKDAGLLDNHTTDFSKTTSVRLVSEQIGPDLYRQVHLVKYHKKNGEVIEALAISDASSEECSMKWVELFLIKERLGP
ncbi:MAG: hypothetical protein C0609_06265 [Deltaproteobacteria bacterium]|nr:MAG: hypothetical protein C0609_06265 [Deltaproteobacteria bacterium]